MERRTYHSAVQKRDASSACENGTVPACLQDLYSIPLTPAVNKDNILGVTGFYGNEAHYSYLEVFLTKYRPDMNPTTNFTSVGLDGGTNDQNAPSVEEGVRSMYQLTLGVADIFTYPRSWTSSTQSGSRLTCRWSITSSEARTWTATWMGSWMKRTTCSAWTRLPKCSPPVMECKNLTYRSS